MANTIGRFRESTTSHEARRTRIFNCFVPHGAGLVFRVMNLRPALAAALMLPPAACTAPEDPGRASAQIGLPDCGIASRPWSLNRLRPPAASGDAIRACDLPAAAEIERACETLEGEPIRGSTSPDNPDSPDYAFPDHQVQDARCHFTDASRSRAKCAFQLTAPDAVPASVSAELIYRYRDLSNSLVHGYHVVNWEVDAVCRPT
jgi:hypothetical protein